MKKLFLGVFLFSLISYVNASNLYESYFNYGLLAAKFCQEKKDMVETFFLARDANKLSDKMDDFNEIFGKQKVTEMTKFNGNIKVYQDKFFKDCVEEIRQKMPSDLPN